MTKEELIEYSAAEVRRSKELFDEYLRIYIEEKGKRPSCAACSFASTFNKWAAQSKAVKIPKPMADNTFILKDEKKNFIVPFSGGKVLNSYADDSIAELYLSQRGNGIDEIARENLFIQLPESMRTKDAPAAIVPDAPEAKEDKVDSITVGSVPKPKAKAKRKTKAKKSDS